MNQLRRWLIVCVVMAVAGCASTQTYNSDSAPEYVIIQDFTPFYKNGPMQGMGPNASLTASTRVKLLKQDMGYSYIQLPDGRTGYVANESMAPAPPRPPESRLESDDASADSSRSGRGKKRPSSPKYTGEQLNDIPLPDPNVPAPDLNVAPEELPSAIPSPTPSAEKPKFRY